jgi:tetratricopeptide (TPR) repeat protein
MNNHPTAPVLRAFLRSLSVADAGLLLHLLECPRCSRRAWKELSPRPMRRRPGEPRALDAADSGDASAASAHPAEESSLAGAERCRNLARERREERRTDEALALFERSAALYSRAGLPWEQATVLGELAGFLLELGQEEEALSAFERILDLGATVADPGLAAGSTAGLAGRLAALDDPLEGRRLLSLLRERLGRRRAAQQRLDLIRSEGLLAAFTRQEHQAEKSFRDAWNGYLRAGVPGHAVLAVIDLSILLLRQARGTALRDLASEVGRAFRGRDLPKTVRNALDNLLPGLDPAANSGQASTESLAVIAVELARTLSTPASSVPAAPGTA